MTEPHVFQGWIWKDWPNHWLSSGCWGVLWVLEGYPSKYPWAYSQHFFRDAIGATHFVSQLRTTWSCPRSGAAVAGVINLQCGSWTGAATHLIRLKHGVPLKKSNSLFFTQYQIMIFGKEPQCFWAISSGNDFHLGETSSQELLSTSHLWGAQWGLRIRSCQGSDSRLFFPTDLQRLRDKPPFYTAFPNNKNFEAHAEAGNCCDLWSVASGHRLHLPSGRGSRENRRENQADGRWKTCFPYENSQVNRVIIVCWHDCCFHR